MFKDQLVLHGITWSLLCYRQQGVPELIAFYIVIVFKDIN